MSYKDTKMKSWATANGLNIQLSEFKISKTRITNLMKRIGLSLQRCTTVSQKLLETYNKKLLEFRRYIEDLRRR